MSEESSRELHVLFLCNFLTFTPYVLNTGTRWRYTNNRNKENNWLVTFVYAPSLPLYIQSDKKAFSLCKRQPCPVPFPQPVLRIRIRIHRIHKFFGPLGSFYHHAKIVKKNLDSCYFVALFDFFIFEKLCK
jgi:hypothetical protein